MILMGCLACGAGFCDECTQRDTLQLQIQQCCGRTSLCSQSEVYSNASGIIETIEESEGKGRGRPQKDDADVLDPLSTGRKRANRAYPLDKTADCEWTMLANVGGGLHPIVGCIGGKQETTQHGPDKNTLNISEGNVHRICHRCHNLWHYHNDGDYNPDGPFIPNDPRPATLDELTKWSKKETRPKALVPRKGTFVKKEEVSDLPSVQESTPL